MNYAVDADVDLPFHEISCAFLLQVVRLSYLVPRLTVLKHSY